MLVYYRCMDTIVNTKLMDKTKKIGRPTTKPQDRVLQMRVDEEFLGLVDDWRGGQRPIPNRAEAIRRLVKIAIKRDK